MHYYVTCVIEVYTNDDDSHDNSILIAEQQHSMQDLLNGQYP